MQYPNKSISIKIFVVGLISIPLAGIAANDLPIQVAPLHQEIVEIDKKVTALALEQRKTSETISSLQSDLNGLHQTVNNLNNREALISVSSRRTANGHGH